MASRDSWRDCRIGSPISLRERGLGVRVQYLLNPDAEVEDIPTLTPALSRRGRGGYAGYCRLTPMGAGGEVDSFRRLLLAATRSICPIPHPWHHFSDALARHRYSRRRRRRQLRRDEKGAKGVRRQLGIVGLAADLDAHSPRVAVRVDEDH